MICKYHVNLFCKEDISLIENYDKAINDKSQTWHCHHRDEIRILPSGITVIRTAEELIENGRYYNCPANELIFLTENEHMKLHNKYKQVKEETRNKLSDINIKEFGRLFQEIYGIRPKDNKKLYNAEHHYYKRNGKLKGGR